MNREEIRDLLDMNYDNNKDWLINYIFFMEQERDKFKNALEVAQEIINNSVTKDRYNNLVIKYNNLVKKTKQGKFVNIN